MTGYEVAGSIALGVLIIGLVGCVICLLTFKGPNQ